MKKILMALAILAVTAGPALAAEQETLIKGDHEHGGFGGPVVKFTTFDFEPGVVVGGRGGWIIDHKLVIGGGGYGLTKNLNKDDGNYSDESQLSFGYGGFELEYIFGSDKLVHGSIYTLIGGGSLTLMGNENDNHMVESNEYFVFEPDLNLELNVAKFFRIGLGLGYRVVAGDEFHGYDYLGLSGVTGTLTFKFGKF
ncbi:MAG: hypothetical protein NT009_15125 [Proteobacteria bacterium]|nr:hypothetical protein [Pseudomonadota bacterium]